MYKRRVGMFSIPSSRPDTMFVPSLSWQTIALVLYGHKKKKRAVGDETKTKTKTETEDGFFFFLFALPLFLFFFFLLTLMISSETYSEIGTCEKRHSFLNFPYVCPEPVLVKCSFIYIYTNGAKSGVVFRTRLLKRIK
jgi:hypothetical protein